VPWVWALVRERTDETEARSTQAGVEGFDSCDGADGALDEHGGCCDPLVLSFKEGGDQGFKLRRSDNEGDDGGAGDSCRSLLIVQFVKARHCQSSPVEDCLLRHIRRLSACLKQSWWWFKLHMAAEKH